MMLGIPQGERQEECGILHLTKCGATGAALLSRFAAIKLAFDFGSKQHRFKKRKSAPVRYERCLMPESKDNQVCKSSQGWSSCSE